MNTMDDDRHRRFVKQERFVQAARLGVEHRQPSRERERVYEALQAAARNGHARIVQDLLSSCNININGFLRDADINLLFSEPKGVSMSSEPHKTWYFYGEKMLLSPLHLAVREGHGQVVQELVSFLKSQGALHSNKQKGAAMRKQKEEVARKWFQGLVEWAVRWGHASIVKQLLPIDDQALLPIEGVVLPLHLAAHLGHSEVLKVLLQLLPRTKLPSLSSEEDPIISTSSIPRPFNQEALAALRLNQRVAARLEKSLSSFSEDGLTALHLAAQCGCLSAVEHLVTTTQMDVNLASSTESVTSLHIAKMDVDLRSSPEFFTPLHMAASFGHVEVVRFLLREDGDPSARDCMGRTALHYAAREGHVAVAQELLSCKLAIASHIASIPDNDGLLPLHMAAKGGHVEVIRTLRSCPEGISSTSTYKAKHSFEMRRWVERVYINDGGMMYHSYFSRKWRFPRPMLVDSFFWRTEGFTPLHFAARHGHESAVRELLQLQENEEMGVGERVRHLLLKDSGGFLAYDWMEVQKQGEVFIKHATEGIHSHQDRLIVEQRLKEGSYVVMSNMRRNKRVLKIASEIEEEKQALAELYHAWESGNPELHNHADWESGNNQQAWGKCNPDLPIRVCILQWLIQSEGYSAFFALVESLKQGSFAFAKEILLLQPEISRDLRLGKEVKEVLMSRPLPMAAQEPNNLQETFLMELVTTEGLIGASNLMRWLLPWATEKHLTGLVDVILDRPELKRGLYEDRQVYLDCANAILVGAALIAGVAFQGWLQPPLGYGFQYEGESYAEVEQRVVRLFWWFNNGAFFLAVGSLIAGAKGAVPVAKETDIVSSLAKVRRAVAVASILLGAALVCVVGAFTTAGVATLPPVAHDRDIMHTSASAGATICGLALLWFFVSVWPLVAETIMYWSKGFNNHVWKPCSEALMEALMYWSKAFVETVLYWSINHAWKPLVSWFKAHWVVTFCILFIASVISCIGFTALKPT